MDEVERLVAALKDGNPEVRIGAAMALGDIGDASAVPALGELLAGDENYEAIDSAARALGKIGVPALPALLNALRCGNEAVKRILRPATTNLSFDDAEMGVDEKAMSRYDRILVRTITGIRLDREHVDAVISMLAHGKTARERNSAAVLLIPLRNARAVPALVKAIEDPDASVRYNAASALGGIAEKNRRKADAVVPALVRALKDDLMLVRNKASASLCRIMHANPGNPEALNAVRPLIEALEPDFWCVKCMDAERAFKKIGAPATAELILALKNGKRGIAASLLGRIGVDDGQYDAIRGMLKRGPTREERIGGMMALGSLRDARAVPDLIEALKDEDGDVRYRAVNALGEIGDASAIPALVGVLKDEYGDVRYRAVFSLGEIGTPAVPALINAMNDDDEKLQIHIIWRLGEISEKNPDVLDIVLPELFRVREAKTSNAVEDTVKSGLFNLCKIPAVPALSRLLKHEDANLRRWAASELDSVGLEHAGIEAKISVCLIFGWPKRIANIVGIQAIPLLTRALNGEDVGPGVSAGNPAVMKGAAEAILEIAIHSKRMDLIKIVEDKLMERALALRKSVKCADEARDALIGLAGLMNEVAARKNELAGKEMEAGGLILAGERPKPPKRDGGMYRGLSRPIATNAR